MLRLSITTLSQSSSRPTMMVQTGPMLAISSPCASRRFEPALHGLGHGDGIAAV